MRVSVLSLVVLSLGCGDHDGVFKGTFETTGAATPLDLSELEADEVNIVQWRLARCGGGFLSSSSDCKLTYWENKDPSKRGEINERQIVFRMHGYPEDGLEYPVKSLDGGVFVSVEYLEFPNRKLSENEAPPSWDATSGSVITESVNDKGFKYRVVDVEFERSFKLNGTGELYAPAPAKE